MPDITMCASETCYLRKMCYRNPESGTKPDEYRQSWFYDKSTDGDDCTAYWQKDDAK